MEAGATWDAEQDGFSNPESPGEVLKTVNGVDVIVEADGSVTMSVYDSIKQVVVGFIPGKDPGGWYGEEYINEHSDWQNLYNHSFYDNTKKMCLAPR